jgi:hypothetical protein
MRASAAALRLAGLAVVLLALAAARASPASAALPTVDYALTGAAGEAGWYVGAVTVKWTVSGETSSDMGCLTRTLTADTTGTQLTCTASNGDGTVPATTKAIKIDQTPPSGVTVLAARPPDRPPWYVGPLPLAWSGVDVTSGIAACTAITYSGPDGPSLAPTGGCRDVAGNVSADVPFALAFDATPPALADLAATVSHRTATVRWAPGADAQQVTVTRHPGDGGADLRTVASAVPGTTSQIIDGPLTPGVAYTWTATVRDAAGNQTSATTTATVEATRKLTWRARSGAKYYNFQLFRNGRKILSVWPDRAHYTLQRTWRFNGRTRKLTAGTYRWYVWPGYGARARHRYGRLLAHGELTFR